MKSEKTELPLRMLLVSEISERSAALKHTLQEIGYRIVAHVSSSTDLPVLAEEIKPDVIVLNTGSPDRELLEYLSAITRDQPCPMVMFTHEDDSEQIRVAIRAGISAYVVDEPQNVRLRPIMDAAIARFNEFQTLRTSLEQAEQRLVQRRDIERAKGILMKQRGCQEEEAYQALRRLAMDKGLKLAEVARRVIMAAEMLG